MATQPDFDMPNFDLIAQKARKIIGDDADAWLYDRNRHLAGLSPFEMTRSEAGARLVFRELGRLDEELVSLD